MCSLLFCLVAGCPKDARKWRAWWTRIACIRTALLVSFTHLLFSCCLHSVLLSLPAPWTLTHLEDYGLVGDLTAFNTDLCVRSVIEYARQLQSKTQGSAAVECKKWAKDKSAEFHRKLHVSLLHLLLLPVDRIWRTKSWFCQTTVLPCCNRRLVATSNANIKQRLHTLKACKDDRVPRKNKMSDPQALYASLGVPVSASAAEVSIWLVVRS